MKLLQHRENKDTAIEILQENEDGTALVMFFNVTKVALENEGEPVFLGMDLIRLQSTSEYKVLQF